MILGCLSLEETTKSLIIACLSQSSEVSVPISREIPRTTADLEQRVALIGLLRLAVNPVSLKVDLLPTEQPEEDVCLRRLGDNIALGKNNFGGIDEGLAGEESSTIGGLHKDFLDLRGVVRGFHGRDGVKCLAGDRFVSGLLVSSHAAVSYLVEPISL